ncbi:MerC domain-containing protein [Erythrobacter sp.]|uniref:MerC domain-containing protein n=1 Tax=Erythrobacter sp. TaxID=1042 RepID=UPI001425F240|nr:MerC domain-containing protein [Erythrobacter sp.]QIQ86712.1 MAG: MerC domain-containing protein [Erythrobacter sp.]
MKTAPNPLFDSAGIALSALCLGHCLALPVALALLPVLASSGLASLAEAELFHAALLVPVFLVSGTVLGRRALVVRWLGPLLVVALGAMTGALFVEAEWQEQALTAGGASLLIIAHWLNLRGRVRA